MNATQSIFTNLNRIPPSLPNSNSVSSIHPQFKLFSRNSFLKFTVKASINSSTSPQILPKSPILSLKNAAAALIFSAATFGNFNNLQAKAEVLSPPASITEGEDMIQTKDEPSPISNSPLAQLLESNSEAIDALKTLLHQKLESGEDEEGLSILKELSAAQPDNHEWKLLSARVLNELGKIKEARDTLEEILAKNPLSFEALFENALLMDRSGEGEAVMRRLEEALSTAETENKAKEARDVKLVIAQMQFLQKNLDAALGSYDELLKEDPSDFRPYFCKGMIFSLMDKNEEAREQFAKYRELSPKKFEVEGYLRTPLSRMKLFGTEEDN